MKPSDERRDLKRYRGALREIVTRAAEIEIENDEKADHQVSELQRIAFDAIAVRPND